MGRPILRLATRLNRRTRWTAWAIAFACMVLVGSLSLAEGLSGGGESVASRCQPGPSVYVHGSDLMDSRIDPTALPMIPGDFLAVRVHAGTLEMNNVSLPVVVAALQAFQDGNASVPFPAGAPDSVAIDVGLEREIVAASGQPLDANVTLSVFGLRLASLPVSPPPMSRPGLFPDTWAWVRPELLTAAGGVQGMSTQAVITPSPLDPALVSRLGLTPLTTIGGIGFARGSVQEARAAVDALALLVAVVIGLLVYSAMGLEVQQRRQEIRVLRSLGASSSAVAAVYEGQAVVLGLVGATLGSALGIVLAHAIVSFAPLLGMPNLITLPAPAAAVAFVYLLTLVAAVLAGLVPSTRAVRLLRGVREVGPS